MMPTEGFECLWLRHDGTFTGDRMIDNFRAVFSPSAMDPERPPVVLDVMVCIYHDGDTVPYRAPDYMP